MAFESRYIKGTLYLHSVESKGYKHKTLKWQAFEQGRSGHIGWQRVTLSNHVQRGVGSGQMFAGANCKNSTGQAQALAFPLIPYIKNLFSFQLFSYFKFQFFSLCPNVKEDISCFYSFNTHASKHHSPACILFSQDKSSGHIFSLWNAQKHGYTMVICHLQLILSK